MTTMETERDFMEDCHQRGWRYSGRPDGSFPSVAGTYEWDKAFAEARASQQGRTVERKISDAKALVKKYNLTSAQFDVLRKAARKWANYALGLEHDGEVSTYGVMQTTLDILRERGLIAKVYKIDNQDARAAAQSSAETLIRDVYRRAAVTVNPLADNLWRDTLADLAKAKAQLDSLAAKVTRITDQGRLLATEWKLALGAVADESEPLECARCGSLTGDCG